MDVIAQIPENARGMGDRGDIEVCVLRQDEVERVPYQIIDPMDAPADPNDG